MKQPKGIILYRGPSVLDDQPIVAVATLGSANRKTGNMIQVWIIRDGIHPVAATQTGHDASVCGSCPHRHHTGGACYVNVGQAPTAVYRGIERGIYPDYDPMTHDRLFKGRSVRFGAYGDPAAVPYDIFADIASKALSWTGYTHQARHKRFDSRYMSLCMVSADSEKQASYWQQRGAKTFRVASDSNVLADEVRCIAEQDDTVQCADCMLCHGKDATSNVVIRVHGSRAKRFTDKRTRITAVNVT